MDDFALLHRYTREGSQEASRQVVGRYLGLVYSAANPGRNPQDPSELAPYFSDPQLAQKYLRDQVSRRGQPH
ncbi:MAG TPA: hypothetical protein VHC86_09550 [Opitutaceae bacterium]|nr:hypothetical protein [Opitutaceae bacterium]